MEGELKIVSLTIEQPNKDLNRYCYDEKSHTFYQTPLIFLAASKGYTGAYGWLDDTYLGPQKHLDAFYLTERRCHLGDSKKGVLCGALYRANGDHKMIVMDYTVMDRMKKYDFSFLPMDWRHQLNSVFGKLKGDEKWINAKKATELLQHYLQEMRTNPLNISRRDPQEEPHKLMSRY